MEPSPENQSMRPIHPSFGFRFESEACDQCAQIRVSPADLSNRGFERPMFSLDRAKPPSHRGRRFEDLDLVTRSHEPSTTDEASQSASYNDDRRHLDDSRTDTNGGPFRVRSAVRSLEHPQQGLRDKGLGKKLATDPAELSRQVRRQCVAAGQDDLEIGTGFQELGEEGRRAVPVGHHDIEQHDLDLRHVLTEDRPRLGSGRCGQHLVAPSFDDPRDQPQELIFVIHDEGGSRFRHIRTPYPHRAGPSRPSGGLTPHRMCVRRGSTREGTVGAHRMSQIYD